MFELLELYKKPHCEAFPVVCLDEKSVELHDEKHAPIRSKSGIKRDYEYIRRGTGNLFVMTEPRGGKHYVRVTKRRTRKDFARCLKWLTQRYPDATKIHLVLDNLNTHNEKSLVQTFGEVEGRKIWARFAVHYTPKHGSWLNPAEIAICVTQRCCLGRSRVSTLEELRKQVIPFWRARRAQGWEIDWRFTKKKAKVWLKAFGSRH